MSLKRGLNLPLLLFYGVGNILGAGIYVLVGEVASVAGYLAPLSFVISAVIAGLTGLTYIELASRFPVSAGEAVYVDEAFHIRRLSIVVGLLVCASGIISAAALAKGFVGYMQLFTGFPGELIVVLMLGVLCLVAIVGITESVSIAAFFTILEIAGLLLILWVCRDALLSIPEKAPVFAVSMEVYAWSGVMAGAFLSFFAFIGFEDMVNVVEEVKNPQKTLPKAIILSLIICSSLYFFIALAAVLQVAPDLLAKDGAPLATVYQAATGNEPVFIGILGLFAIVNGILIQIIMVSRIFYGMAEKNWLPGFLGKVNTRFQTPGNATLLAVIIIVILALTLPLISLASLTSMVVLSIFALVNFSLLFLKARNPDPGNINKVPWFIPVLGLMTSLILITMSLYLF